jgi:hypothetical protein
MQQMDGDCYARPMQLNIMREILGMGTKCKSTSCLQHEPVVVYLVGATMLDKAINYLYSITLIYSSLSKLSPMLR